MRAQGRSGGIGETTWAGTNFRGDVGGTETKLAPGQAVGTALLLFMLGLYAAYLLWSGVTESRPGPLFGGLFLLTLMGYAIVHTVRAAARVEKGRPTDLGRGIRILTFWLSFAAVAGVAVLVFGVSNGTPLAAGLPLLANFGLLVGWIAWFRKASRAQGPP